MSKLVVLVVLILLIVACSGNSTSSIEKNGNWRIVKSPITGYCYEVYQFSSGHSEPMGISRLEDRWCND